MLVLTSPFTQESAHVTLSYLVGPTHLPVVCCHPRQCIFSMGKDCFSLLLFPLSSTWSTVPVLGGDTVRAGGLCWPS